MPNDRLLTAYYRLAHEGDTEPERLSRAYTLVLNGQADDRVAEYGATAQGCTCPDYGFREPSPCKHVLVCRLLEMAEADRPAPLEQSMMSQEEDRADGME